MTEVWFLTSTSHIVGGELTASLEFTSADDPSRRVARREKTPHWKLLGTISILLRSERWIPGRLGRERSTGVSSARLAERECQEPEVETPGLHGGK